METEQIKEIINIMWKDLKDDISDLKENYKMLNAKIESNYEHLEDKIEIIKEDTSNVKTELSNLRLKSSIWGAVTGSLSSLGLGSLNNLLK